MLENVPKSIELAAFTSSPSDRQ